MRYRGPTACGGGEALPGGVHGDGPAKHGGGGRPLRRPSPRERAATVIPPRLIPRALPTPWLPPLCHEVSRRRGGARRHGGGGEGSDEEHQLDHAGGRRSAAGERAEDGSEAGGSKAIPMAGEI